MCLINSGSILKFFRILVMYKCTYLYIYNARKIKQNISCFVCTFICTFDSSLNNRRIMKTEQSPYELTLDLIAKSGVDIHAASIAKQNTRKHEDTSHV